MNKLTIVIAAVAFSLSLAACNTAAPAPAPVVPPVIVTPPVIVEPTQPALVEGFYKLQISGDDVYLSKDGVNQPYKPEAYKNLVGLVLDSKYPSKTIRYLTAPVNVATSKDVAIWQGYAAFVHTAKQGGSLEAFFRLNGNNSFDVSLNITRCFSLNPGNPLEYQIGAVYNPFPGKPCQS